MLMPVAEKSISHADPVGMRRPATCGEREAAKNPLVWVARQRLSGWREASGKVVNRPRPRRDRRHVIRCCSTLSAPHREVTAFMFALKRRPAQLARNEILLMPICALEVLLAFRHRLDALAATALDV
jgi:hypothetical protein